MKNSHSILRTWITILAGLAIVVGAVNVLVDPYEVFGTPRIAGISLIKPIATNHTMLAKTFQVARSHLVTVLIGPSPVDFGIDASALAWPNVMKPVYNYGIPGPYDISTSLRTLQEAIATGTVRNAIVFLDFQRFLDPETANPALVDADRRYRFMPDGTSNPNSATQRVTDMVRSVGTLTALTDSLTTVLLQRRSNMLNLAPDGTGTEATFIEAARIDGMHDQFAQTVLVQARRAENAAEVITKGSGNLPGLDAAAAIIAFARAHDVKLTLVIEPHHVDVLELYWRAGLWPRMEALKTALTTLVAAQGGAVTLWDFLDYSSFNTEPVPDAGDRRTPTSWFWDPIHFKKQLGDVMIQRMFGSDAPIFGTELTLNTLVEHNAGIRADREAVVCERREVVLAVTGTTAGDGCGQGKRPHGPT